MTDRSRPLAPRPGPPGRGAPRSAARAAQRPLTPLDDLAAELARHEKIAAALAGPTLLVVGLAVPVTTLLIENPQARLFAGVVTIVALGAAGLILRGVGELRPPPANARWKAAGYFCGAAAYIATATVALLNGLPALVTG